MKTWRWNKTRYAIRTLLMDGMSEEQIHAMMKRTRKRVAKEEQWRPSELACSIAKDREEIRAVAARMAKS